MARILLVLSGSDHWTLAAADRTRAGLRAGQP
jgi:hypothetical protein